MIHDFEGKAAYVGDRVVYVESNYSSLQEGIVKKINKKSIGLEGGGHRFSNQFIIMNKPKIV